MNNLAPTGRLPITQPPRIATGASGLIAMMLTALLLSTTARASDDEATHASAPDFAQLYQQGHVQLRRWIDPADRIAVSQQLTLTIEISTNRWFAGGTRIGTIEVDGAVVLQREKFAVNSSRQVDGASWAVQQWAITLYPQREGRFQVPAIAVNISIAGENQQRIEGVIQTQPLNFLAVTPDAMADRAAWIAVPSLSIDDRFDRELSDLQPGDAVRRTLRIRAEDTAAMMLLPASTLRVEGVANYPRAPRLTDRVNRGEYLAERVETIDYLIERDGRFEVPALSFYWWNTQRGQAERIELPAQHLQTGTAASPDTSPPDALFRGYALPAATLAILALITSIVIILYRRYRRAARRPSRARLLRQCVNACRAEDYRLATRLLYHWLDHADQGPYEVPRTLRSQLQQCSSRELQALFEQLMTRTFADQNNTEFDAPSFIHLLSKHVAKDSHRPWQPSRSPLTLNPR
ncbi:BatD family protein [Aestuariirhabdus sp. Z084]|uniref:BatD family protein n=1 Tax=Aestuariirhabdus haliotis TaxID=2918751 RepID=UPI00201B4589|nr:BatD family protein [Aestuariirhabdus haliotis]MCL6416448.1 BatD family protein [Aestuariirhabdus haliotis]MCL6420385.1 BatD family protein [Aestuariirhabdus haliotis]